MWYVYACTHVRAHTHKHTMEYHSAIRKNEILQFMTVWMDLEGIIHNEISQTEKGILHDVTYMWNLKNKPNEQT